MSGKAHSRKNVNLMDCEPRCIVREHCIEIKRVAALGRSNFQCPIVAGGA